MTWLFGLLLIPWIFWSILGLGLLALIILSESEESGLFAFLIGAIVIGLLYIAGMLPTLTWFDWVKVGAAYLPIGIGYSVLRFKLFCRKKVNEFNESGYEKIAKTAYGQTTQNESSAYTGLKMSLGVNQNKTRITNWIAFWPFSLINYILSDFIREIVDWIYSKIKKIYIAISQSELDRVK